jgi:hypothetical protein
MSRTLLEEIAHQIFSPIPKKKKHEPSKYQNNHKKKPDRDYAYEKMEYKTRQKAFDSYKDFEIKKYHAKSKGWL